MNENNEIDQLFKERLQKQYPVDEGLWTAVESQLDSPVAKSGLWLFNLNTITIIMILFICAIIPTDNVRTSTLANQNTLINEKQSEREKSNELLQIERLNNKAITSIPDESNSQKEVSETKEVQEVKPLKLNENTKQLNNSSNRGTTNYAKTKHQGTLASKLVTKTKKITALAVETEKENPSNLTLGMYEPKTSFTPKINDLELSLMESNGFYYPLSELESSPNLANTNKQFQKKLKRQFYYIELEASQALNSTKKLSGNDEALITYKKNNENSLKSSDFGLNIINQHKFITYGIGVHYSKYTERVKYTVDKEALGYDITYDTSYKLVNGNFNSNGNPVFLIKQTINEIRSPKTIIVDDQITTINTFKRIKVPVFVGLNKTHNNWLAELRTAFVLNYLFEQDGIYIDNDLQQIHDLNEEDQFNQFVYGSRTDFSIGYSINEFVAVGGRFNYEFDISSFTKEYDSKLQNQRVGIWLIWKPD